MIVPHRQSGEMMVRTLVDMDGVLANFSEAINRVILEHGGEIIPPELWTSFRLSDIYPHYEKHLMGAIREQGFYADLTPIEGALEGVQTLQDAGHDVWICTAPVRSRWCAGEKMDWVYRHLGRELAGKTVVTKDKTLVAGDVLVDDKPDIEGADTPRWNQLVFDQPYNRAVTGLPRLTGWNVPDLVTQVKRAAKGLS